MTPPETNRAMLFSDPSGAAEGTSLRQLLLILRRRWRLLALIWITTLAAGSVYTFSSTPLYRPQAMLEIQAPAPIIGTSEANDPAFSASRMNYENYYRTQEQILTSPTIVEATFKALPDVRAEYASMSDPVKAFLDRLDIEKIRTSYILKVGFVDKDKNKATDIVNTLVSLYLEDANRRLRDVRTGAADFLSKETLPTIRQRVDDADQALQAFQQESGFIDFEEHYKSLVEARRRLDGGMIEIRLRRAKLRSELGSLTDYGSNGVTGIFNPAFHTTRSLEPLVGNWVQVEADLSKERKLLKDRHPRILELEEQLRAIERRIKDSIEGTLVTLRTELRAVEFEERELIEEQKEVDKQIGSAGQNLNRYRRLSSDLASAKDLYSSYIRKHGETSATSGATLASVRVLDHATIPVVPFKPKILLNLGLASLVGLLLGIAAVMGSEQLDDRILSPREVEAFVGLEILAAIPKLSEAIKAGKDPILLTEKSALPEFESFRGLRAELITRLEKVQGTKVIAILSASQSEGKSTVSVNLAKVVAMEGRKVLLFDADMRRPSMRGLVGQMEGPGLEEILSGSAEYASAVQKSRIPGVDVLGAREGTTGAAELAGSPRFERALSWARDHYDVVLLDCPPVNQVSESALIARCANAVVMVVREAQTGRSAAASARKRLQGMGVGVAGVVLNCAAKHASGYGYYDYSYYGSRQEGKGK